MGLPGRRGRRRPRGAAPAVRRRPPGPARLAGQPRRALDRSPRAPFGTAVRKTGDAAQTFLAIANDSPYPIRLACLLEAPGDAAVEDLGRGLRLAPTAEAGGRNLVLDLLPFGVSAIRVGAPGVRVASLTRLSLGGRPDGHAGAIPRAGDPAGAAESGPRPTSRPSRPIRASSPSPSPGRPVATPAAGRARPTPTAAAARRGRSRR